MAKENTIYLNIDYPVCLATSSLANINDAVVNKSYSMPTSLFHLHQAYNVVLMIGQAEPWVKEKEKAKIIHFNGCFLDVQSAQLKGCWMRDL